MWYNKNGDDMNNKGFTLVEVIAAIVVIAIISLLVVPKVTTLIKEANTKSYNSLLSTIENGAKEYLYLNKDKIDKQIDANGESTVTILTLQEGGHVPLNLKNPLTKEDIPTSDVVTITRSGNIYTYTYIDE